MWSYQGSTRRAAALAVVPALLALGAVGPSQASGTVPPLTYCVHVVIVAHSATGTETDLPVRMCGIARRYGPWTCSTPGQFGAGMRLTCVREP